MKLMKKLIVLFVFLSTLTIVKAQTSSTEDVEKACMNYIEGFYKGDESKLNESLHPTLNKFGFRKTKTLASMNNKIICRMMKR